MIKGVNKRIVEINNTQNEYFEKAILYIKPEKSSMPQRELSEEAINYLNSLGFKRKSFTWQKLVVILGITLVLSALAVIILLLI
ncbi:MAG: hypothetical protein JG769_912 [Oscillospiraceae bacterium]|jgi:hypothetical protein|nr:hypothetical protein [Oscillospiraceae bacterium]